MAAPQKTTTTDPNVGQDVGLVPSHGISLDVGDQSQSDRPPLLKHLSSPAYDSPLRHHTRHTTAPRQVKESLHAHSEYLTSQDDGTSQHRINQYIIKQEIGRGSFGAVHLATDQYGQEYAVKEFSKSRLRKRAKSHILRGPRKGPSQLQAGHSFNIPLHRHTGDDQDDELEKNPISLIKEEIAIMKKLNHPNLVSLVEVLDDPSEDSLYMVMEMCKKGVVMKVGLGEMADPYENEECRCWFRDLILGIEYLHHQGIVHRDIKPDNCLLTDDDVLKIVDFGVSEMFQKDSEMLTAKSAGSPAFLPPELCVAGHGGISGRAADIWSMGVTLYCLRYGHIPFDKTGIFELYESIRSDEFKSEEESDADFRDLMSRVLEKDPSRRIEMAALREHPWVTKRGADPLLSAEENTAELVAAPTEAEMDNAITSNLGNLMTVMRAVHKFKSLLSRKRPSTMESILGLGGSIVQPPLSMPRPERPHTAQKSHSMDTFDRRPLESALATEGVHREIDLDTIGHNLKAPTRTNTGNTESSKDSAQSAKTSSSTLTVDGQRSKAVSHPPPLTPHDSEESGTPDRMPSSSLSPEAASKSRSPPATQRPTRHPDPHTHTMDESGHRGHAHDPLQDHLYLYIGPSTFSHAKKVDSQLSDSDRRRPSFVPEEDMPDPDGPPIVSESPGAADIDIYEVAYRDEVERIRATMKDSEGEEPTVYLTRRIDETILGIGEAAGKLVGGMEEGASRLPGAASVTGLSRAFKEAARQGRAQKRSKDSQDSGEEKNMDIFAGLQRPGSSEAAVPKAGKRDSKDNTRRSKHDAQPPGPVASPISMDTSPGQHFQAAFDSSRSGIQGLWSKVKDKQKK